MVLTTQSSMDVERARLWDLIEATPMLDWLLLTKRPENIRTMVPLRWLHDVPHNVWYGTSTENQEQADIRIPELLKVPATVRFLSAEPLLGPVDLRPGLGLTFDNVPVDAPQLHWVIAGGESGSRARPMDAEWVRSIRNQCVGAGVAFFFKQWGGRTSKSNGRELDGQLWSEFPVIDPANAHVPPVELAAD
jgi:protein gp37